MQAWAAFASAGAIIYAAHKGSATLRAWKRQKLEERRMDAAERVLIVAYRVRGALIDVRRPGIGAIEDIQAEQTLRASKFWEGLNSAQKERHRASEVTTRRLAAYKSTWEAILEIAPIARAYFGDAVSNDLDRLWDQYLRVMIAAGATPTSVDEGRREWDADVLCSLGRDISGGPGDVVGPSVQAAVESLERILIPIIRAD
jgi:hypothetical protein